MAFICLSLIAGKSYLFLLLLIRKVRDSLIVQANFRDRFHAFKFFHKFYILTTKFECKKAKSIENPWCLYVCTRTTYTIEQNPAIPLKGQIRTEAVGRSADVILLFKCGALFCCAVCAVLMSWARKNRQQHGIYACMQCICVYATSIYPVSNRVSCTWCVYMFIAYSYVYSKWTSAACVGVILFLYIVYAREYMLLSIRCVLVFVLLFWIVIWRAFTCVQMRFSKYYIQHKCPRIYILYIIYMWLLSSAHTAQV